jgi:hypothetical protein
MAEDPVNKYAATLPTSISTPTIKDSRIANRASRPEIPLPELPA